MVELYYNVPSGKELYRTHACSREHSYTSAPLFLAGWLIVLHLLLGFVL